MPSTLLRYVSFNTSSLKEILRTSHAFQRVFSTASIAMAALQVRQGKNIPALETLFRAWRASRASGFPEKGHELLWRILERTCLESGRLAPISRNRILSEFQASSQANDIRKRFAAFPQEDRSRLRFPRKPDDPERQGNLIVLKSYDAHTGERGVLLLKYGESFLWFSALFDLEEVAKRYALVLEPCWAGYQDWRFLTYLGSDLNAVVLSPHPIDFDFIESLRSNLTPIRLGAGDWVDPDTFKPQGEVRNRFDVVMVSSWNPLKRHKDLLKAVAKLKQEGYEGLQVALVGSPTVWSRDEIENMIDSYGLQHNCTIFEDIPHHSVGEVVASSRVFVLASRQEGANKALYEALFCDTPVIAYSGHRSVNPDHVGPNVGVRFTAGRLHEGIKTVLSNEDQFSPRDWAIRNTGWPVATEKLARLLQRSELERTHPWIRPIAPKKNAPNLQYAERGAYRHFEEEYRALAALMVI